MVGPELGDRATGGRAPPMAGCCSILHLKSPEAAFVQLALFFPHGDEAVGPWAECAKKRRRNTVLRGGPGHSVGVV